MWGNRLGWMISAGIVVVTIGIYGMLIFGLGETKPTKLTTQAGAMDAMEIPGNPRSLIPAGNGGDGTELYIKALDAFKSNRSAYTGTAKLDAASLKKLTALDYLLQASNASKATVFATRPETVVRYGREQHVAIDTAYELGTFCNNIGQRLKANKRPDEAKKYFIAAFNLGYWMCNERLVYMEFWRGQELMQNAVIGLAEVEPDKEGPYMAWREELKQVIDSSTSTFVAKRDAIRTIDKRVLTRHAGDVFNLARNSKDRMWRVEAILALGHFKYRVGNNPGDQRAVKKTLEALAADDSLDPAARVAVKAAQELTLEDHHRAAQMP